MRELPLMSIPVACLACGKTGSVRDSLAGTETNCPDCGETIFVRPAEASPLRLPSRKTGRSAPPRVPRPFWKDRVVLAWSALPLLLAAAAILYLLSDVSRKRTEARVAVLAAQAEDSLAAGKSDAALARFAELAALVPDPDAWPPEVGRPARRAHELGRRLRREAQERVAREELQRQSLAAAEAGRARLAGIRASIAGGAWIKSNAGLHENQKGLAVYLVPASVRKAAAESVLADALRKSASKEKSFGDWAAGSLGEVKAWCEERARISTNRRKAIEETLHLDPDEPVALDQLFNLCRNAYISSFTSIDPPDYPELVADAEWPRFIERIAIAKAATRIDGTYEFSIVPGGEYRLYARAWTHLSFIDWLVPLAVNASIRAPLDLYNDNAKTIANKLDDQHGFDLVTLAEAMRCDTERHEVAAAARAAADQKLTQEARTRAAEAEAAGEVRLADITRRRDEATAATAREQQAKADSKRKATVLLSSADRMEQRGESKAAIAAYRELVAAFPDSPQADHARYRVRELDPAARNDPAFKARPRPKLTADEHRRDLDHQLAERNREKAAKSANVRSANDQAAALAPAVGRAARAQLQAADAAAAAEASRQEATRRAASPHLFRP